jgi:hypothetical protein
MHLVTNKRKLKIFLPNPTGEGGGGVGESGGYGNEGEEGFLPKRGLTKYVGMK